MRNKYVTHNIDLYYISIIHFHNKIIRPVSYFKSSLIDYRKLNSEIVHLKKVLVILW